MFSRFANAAHNWNSIQEYNDKVSVFVFGLRLGKDYVPGLNTESRG